MPCFELPFITVDANPAIPEIRLNTCGVAPGQRNPAAPNNATMEAAIVANPAEPPASFLFSHRLFSLFVFCSYTLFSLQNRYL